MEHDLVAVGEVMLDVVLPALRADQVTHAPIAVRAGGVPVNAAVAAARLGARTSVIGRVGCDAAAAAIRHDLEREGVHADLADDPLRATGTFVRSGQTIVADRGANRFLDEDDVSSSRQTRAVLVSGHLLLSHDTVAAARAAIDRSSATFTAVVVASARLLTSSGRASFRDVTDGVTVLFANADEGHALTDSPPAEAAAILARSYQIAFVTDAERGAHVAWGGHLAQRASIVVSSPAVGAGDAFAGAALYALARGAAPDAALDQAVRAGGEWARETHRTDGRQPAREPHEL